MAHTRKTDPLQCVFVVYFDANATMTVHVKFHSDEHFSRYENTSAVYELDYHQGRATGPEPNVVVPRVVDLLKTIGVSDLAGEPLPAAAFPRAVAEVCTGYAVSGDLHLVQDESGTFHVNPRGPALVWTTTT